MARSPAWPPFLDGKWKAELAVQNAAGHPPTSEVAKAAAFNVIKTALDGLSTHLGQSQTTILLVGPSANIAPGQTPTFVFQFGGGKYRVRFKVAAP